MMKRIVLLLATFSLIIFGQIVSPVPCSQASPGQQCVVSIQLAGQPTPVVVGIQYTLTYATALGNPTVTVGSGVPTKTVNCTNPAVSQPNSSLKCIVIGENATVMGNVEIAKATFALPAALPAGQYIMAIGAVTAVDANANFATVGAGGPINISIQVFGDLNGDGVFNGVDVVLAALQTLGASACTIDQNSDSACDLRDLYLWIKKAKGF